MCMYMYVYTSGIGIISPQLGLFLPNIAFLRLLRFLKPLGRVRILFASKIVVKVDICMHFDESGKGQGGGRTEVVNV